MNNEIKDNNSDYGYLNVTAIYSKKPQKLIYESSFLALDEVKINYDLGFIIGFALLGSYVTEHNRVILWVSIAFILYGIGNLVRYIIKRRNILYRE
jgi:hypothetical protein